ncbi:hypothetical protein BOX15_Mlig007627g3 [Macrostomum lignano]|uniref:phosphoenolpyruvate carboxykinase (GTP) n=1 Tax=Macrostomum lignano TaxID=282301 RepID=A0A267E2L8_9PLAT|nr:hypothetical protein BOX15_Mlig007627g3 [Macrostomum lignano]
MERGTLHKLTKYPNTYICRTDPRDVARVESRTVVCSVDRYATECHTKDGAASQLAHWISPENMDAAMQERFPGCMAGRMMYVIPFSMGPIGSPLSKIGVELTDSNYVVLCMRLMTRVSHDIWRVLGNNEFVRCLHSVGCPRPVNYRVVNHWSCNPEKVIIAHMPDDRMVVSYGSGYGGNSLLGKKCFALRIAGRIAYDEGWMAEHMLIMSVTNPKGVEKFFVAAFPSACGKTNLAMIQPTLPGYTVRCVGDDIAWMRFNKDGQLMAINPENGFFGVAPGTNHQTNPNAMAALQRDCILTNVAETADGGYFWEGLEDEVDKDIPITTWLGKPYKIGSKENYPSSHPNSRFTAPAKNCPIMHPKWEDPAGVPISGIIFGGRRPEGVPLVIEAEDWKHGVFLGAQVKSEATAAAEFKGKQIMHDPMAMRPFLGYNFGKYLQHWLDMEKPGRKMPKIFHVNWFRKDQNEKFLWPGFGENIRVLDWMMRRVDGEDIAEPTAVGLVPKEGSINTDGLNINWKELFSIPPDYWKSDIHETRRYLEEQVGDDIPPVLRSELDRVEARVDAMK